MAKFYKSKDSSWVLMGDMDGVELTEAHLTDEEERLLLEFQEKYTAVQDWLSSKLVPGYADTEVPCPLLRHFEDAK
jgi:hypothetical protein